MPTVICDWCQYVGQGKDYSEIIEDVYRHELACEERVADEEASKIDAAYEKARDEGLIDFSKGKLKK